LSQQLIEQATANTSANTLLEKEGININNLGQILLSLFAKFDQKLIYNPAL
jgi:hypothetical protein